MKFLFFKISIAVLFSLILITPKESFSQNKMKQIEMEREAHANFQLKNFHVALPLFIKLDSINGAKSKYHYEIGVCYIALDDNVNALVYLERCLSNINDYPPAIHYYLGRSYHLSHRFDEAIKFYLNYKTAFVSNKSKSSKQLVEEVDRTIQMCMHGKKLIADSLELEIVNLGPEINSEFPEYGPVISADEKEIIFTSNRPTTTGGNIDPIDGLFYEDIYISTKVGNKWSTPIQMSTNINTINHDASIALSPDGQTLFLYRFDGEEKGSNASGDLYFAQLSGNIWGKAEKLSNMINTESWEPSASITEDGNTLFFVSNKEGGKGGTDLYYSQKLPDGRWDKAVNLTALNTEFDEDCPYIHPNGKTLYFSSKGHNSMGGFDVFVAEFNSQSGQWEKPMNYGYPISTAHDDLHFVVTANAKRIYFSSGRSGGYGNKDIFYANIGKKEAAKVLLISGIISDSITGKPIEALIRVQEKGTNNLIESHTSNSLTGKYTLILNFGLDYELFYTNPKYGTGYDHLNLTKEIFFNELEHNVYLVNKSREVSIIIQDKVSQKGLTSKVKLTNLNTREISIIDEMDTRDGRYNTKLREGNLYNIEINKMGYIVHSSDFTVPVSSLNNHDSIKVIVPLEPIIAGSGIVLNNIYFGTDEERPLASSLEELDKVVDFLKINPTTSIEISAHTDDVGDDNYNLLLSERRAKEVVSYIASKGIDPLRLKAKGFGKNKPIRKGFTEQDRKENRRVELTIISTK